MATTKAQLEQENARLRKENEALQLKVETLQGRLKRFLVDPSDKKARKEQRREAKKRSTALKKKARKNPEHSAPLLRILKR
jgi:regulator of replication initiation timing